MENSDERKQAAILQRAVGLESVTWDSSRLESVILRLEKSTPDPRFRGEGSWFYFSENVPKRSYSNAEFQKFPEVPDPRFWEGEGKLPPLEIMSGYATAEVRSSFMNKLNLLSE